MSAMTTEADARAASPPGSPGGSAKRKRGKKAPADTTPLLGLKSTMLKTSLCRHWEKGHCKYGDTCGFAHGEHELSQNARGQRQSSVISSNIPQLQSSAPSSRQPSLMSPDGMSANGSFNVDTSNDNLMRMLSNKQQVQPNMLGVGATGLMGFPMQQPGLSSMMPNPAGAGGTQQSVLAQQMQVQQLQQQLQMQQQLQRNMQLQQLAQQQAAQQQLQQQLQQMGGAPQQQLQPQQPPAQQQQQNKRNKKGNNNNNNVSSPSAPAVPAAGQNQQQLMLQVQQQQNQLLQLQLQQQQLQQQVLQQQAKEQQLLTQIMATSPSVQELAASISSLQQDETSILGQSLTEQNRQAITSYSCMDLEHSLQGVSVAQLAQTQYANPSSLTKKGEKGGAEKFKVGEFASLNASTGSYQSDDLQGDSISSLPMDGPVSSNPDLMHLVLTRRRTKGTVTALGEEPTVQIPGVGDFGFAYKSVKREHSHKLQVGSKVDCILSQRHPPRAVSLRILGNPKGDLSTSVSSQPEGMRGHSLTESEQRSLSNTAPSRSPHSASPKVGSPASLTQRSRVRSDEGSEEFDSCVQIVQSMNLGTRESFGSSLRGSSQRGSPNRTVRVEEIPSGGAEAAAAIASLAAATIPVGEALASPAPQPPAVADTVDAILNELENEILESPPLAELSPNKQKAAQEGLSLVPEPSDGFLAMTAGLADLAQTCPPGSPGLSAKTDLARLADTQSS